MITFDVRNKGHVIGFITTIAILILTGVFVIKWRKDKERKQNIEKKWYVENLEYNFSAPIDTAFILEQHYGFGQVNCSLLSIKEFDYFKEDSLKDYLTQHDRLRFIWKNKGGQINFIASNGRLASNGDSIFVDSSSDKIVIYKNGNKTGEMTISSSLDGY